MKTTVTEAYRRYGATLKNAQWSVSAWASEDTLVVSLWEHHHKKDGVAGTVTFEDRFDRWSGPGNAEFRANLKRALDTDARVRLVLVRAVEPERVQLGEDASKISKTFAVRDDLVGRVAEIDSERYVIEFRRIDA